MCSGSGSSAAIAKTPTAPRSPAPFNGSSRTTPSTASPPSISRPWTTRPTPRRLAVLDRSGQLYEALAAKAKARNEALRTQPPSVSVELQGQRLKMDLPQQPEFVLEPFKFPGDDLKAAELQLSERVRRKELFAFLIIGKAILAPDATNHTELLYHTQTPTFHELPSWLDNTLNAEIRERRFTAAGVDSQQVRQLSRQVPLQRLGLAQQKTTGEVIAAKLENRIATHAVPIGAMLLLFMVVMSSAPALLNTVLEEKMQKISEVLLASVSPFQLMLGKLFGTVLVSLTLSTLYLVSVAWMLWKFGLLGHVPGHLFAWFFLFQLLALLMFGSMFIAVGAACSEIRDAQNLIVPVMMVLLIPMLTWMAVLQSPASPFSRALSLFPPATPLIMFLRIAIPPGVPGWEIALSLVLTTLFTLGSVWVSAKIFRLGILSQGQTPSIPKLIAWVFSK